MENSPALLILLVVFAVDSVMLAGLIALKGLHRRRVRRHDIRRAAYVALLSRHLTVPNNTEVIGHRVAEDPAFLDALIDVRNAVSGPEIDTLRGIVDRYRISQELGRRLASRFPLGRRLRAAVALAELGDESSARDLIQHLGDREPEVRIQCARGLGRMQWTPAIDHIVERFAIETPWVRSRFADTLVGFGAKATWPLVAYIRVNHRFESAGPAAAIRALGVIGDDQAGPPLTLILEEAESVEIQIPLIETLGLLGGPPAAEPVRRMYRSDDWRLRAKAASALGDIRDESSVPLLAEGLEDASWWVRRNSAAALSQTSAGIEALYKALASDDRYARDAATEALVDLGELTRARSNIEAGIASEREISLVDHVTPKPRIPA